MRNIKDNDKSLLEGLVSKYGKNNVLTKVNKMDENTIFSKEPLVALLPTDALDYEWNFDPSDMSPQKFLKLARMHGTVKTLSAFERMWNAMEENIDNDKYYMRIIFEQK